MSCMQPRNILTSAHALFSRALLFVSWSRHLLTFRSPIRALKIARQSVSSTTTSSHLFLSSSFGIKRPPALPVMKSRLRTERRRRWPRQALFWKTLQRRRPKKTECVGEALGVSVWDLSCPHCCVVVCPDKLRSLFQPPSFKEDEALRLQRRPLCVSDGGRPSLPSHPVSPLPFPHTCTWNTRTTSSWRFVSLCQLRMGSHTNYIRFNKSECPARSFACTCSLYVFHISKSCKLALARKRLPNTYDVRTCRNTAWAQ